VGKHGVEPLVGGCPGCALGSKGSHELRVVQPSYTPGDVEGVGEVVEGIVQGPLVEGPLTGWGGRVAPELVLPAQELGKTSVEGPERL